MANKTSQVKQNDAKRIFRAAIDAGFDAARIIYHPDGRLEALATFEGSQKPASGENTWDDVLK